MGKKLDTSWEKAAQWYDKAVGKEGHYYHEKVILPKLIPLLNLSPSSSLVDVCCGQGVLARFLQTSHPSIPYVGLDLSSSLIQSAKTLTKGTKAQFFLQDVTKKFTIKTKEFTHATIILALQNIENALAVLQNTKDVLVKEGKLFIVLNHPCFRIPRLSHWGIDEKKNLQYRRLDCYLSSQSIPIQIHPGKQDTKQTWSFHHPLSTYTTYLQQSGFCILSIEEWISDKVSTGTAAQRENRSRKEFPLFLTLVCQKL